MKELIILDYSSGEVFLYTLPSSNMSQEEIENYIIDTLEFKLSEISWMINSKIQINDERY